MTLNTPLAGGTAGALSTTRELIYVCVTDHVVDVVDVTVVAVVVVVLVAVSMLKVFVA